MQIGMVTLFPDMFKGLEFGVVGRAFENKLLNLDVVNPRDFTEDKHRTVDDRPYGGGPGMLMKVEPLQKAIKALKTKLPKAKVGYLSPQGKPLLQQDLLELSQREELILVAGRYEGIDQRLLDTDIDEQWSLGDYVLSGGELAAMVMIDGITRLLPGALGDDESAIQDSFMDGLLDHPHYTRPEVFNGNEVPDVLLSGNHEAIKQWRLKQALGLTWLNRPDLLAKRELTLAEAKLLAEFKLEYR